MNPLHLQLDVFQTGNTAPVQKSYHNTLPVSGVELTDKNRKALFQESIILNFFQRRPGETFTAWEVYLALGKKIIKDSVKRAITNLMNRGELFKTLELRPGQYPNHKNRAYKLKTK